MKKTTLLLITLMLLSCPEKENKNVVEKKWFQDDNTFIIICKGWPKQGLSEKARIETAKEAALINAQFIARDIFDRSVDVVKNGTVKKYDVFEDYAIVHYVIRYNGLKKLMK